MSKVSINLVTWNGAKYIDNCLRSVFAQTFKDYSILIIDNGSSDETLAIIKEQYPQLKVIEHKKNIGFAKAHNQAIHWSKSDYVLLLNQDVVLASGYLNDLVNFLDNNSMAGSVAGKILRLQDEEKTNYIDSVGLRIYKNYRVVDMGAGEVDEGQYDAITEIFGVSGALPVYRRKALEEIMYQQEYLDESFFSYKEDVDLAHRLITAGWQSWRVPTAVAYHDRTVSSPYEKMTAVKVAQNRQKKSKFAKFYSYRNHLYFLKKNLSRLTLAVFFYELVKAVYVLLFEPRNLRAWKDYFHVRKELKAKRDLIQKRRKISEEKLSSWLS
ncbi:MAG: Glycosyl transferase family protein [Parcubacteria group bacterium GW2011_GWC2_39_14]|nr:MAG: Glycosyl transferase family protein [Parcubacteria group bacterium GW2011_GWC2_39_14]KKR55513.1 MAG: Glycosyl transferase family protein [Parcubacteria group bacterium GW2011_GWA2_40_23]